MGSQTAVDWCDSSSRNTSEVSTMFCAKPKKTAAPINAAKPNGTGGNTRFQHHAPINAVNPPSIIDGVMRPPYAPAMPANSTASHLAASRPKAACTVSWCEKLNSLPALPLPKISGNGIDSAPMTAKQSRATGSIVQRRRLNFGSRAWHCSNAHTAAASRPPAAADHISRDGPADGGISTGSWPYCTTSPKPRRATQTVKPQVSRAAAAAGRLHVSNRVSSTNTVAAKGTLYTAAKPAPEAQASTSEVCGSVSAKRRVKGVASATLISRGATSRPSGEPMPTVMICSSVWHNVVFSGMARAGCFTVVLMSHSGAP